MRETRWNFQAWYRDIGNDNNFTDAVAVWYRAQDLPVPRNCVVDGNPPITLAQTGGARPRGRFGDPSDPDRVVRRWDAGYRQRAKACGVLLVTEPMLIELHDPVAILPEDLGIFGGRMPSTQNPPRVDPTVVDQLRDLAARRRPDRAA